MLPYGKQTIDDDDIAAVVAALNSNFLTTGPEVEAFEKEFATMVGAKHAVAVCNATAALHLAMLVAEIGEGDRVVTSPNTFVSSANCAAFVGAIPDFADIDATTYNLCPISLEERWKPDTKVVVAVAYAGQSANMPKIAKIARDRKAIVIEDGCHGTGGGFFYEGKAYKIGGHPWADITTFSFHPVKTMTTGEGGMLVTNSDEYAEKARVLRTHGITRDISKFFDSTEGATILRERGSWYYEMQLLGYNYRITDIQCALGRSQLRKLPQFIKRRREIVSSYNRELGDIDWVKTPAIPEEANQDFISWHLYTILIDFDKLRKSRSDVMSQLRATGIGTQVLYIPVYLQPWYRSEFGYTEGYCPQSEFFYQNTLSLPLYPGMTEADVASVIQSIRCLKESI